MTSWHYRLIQKVDLESCLKKFSKSGDGWLIRDQFWDELWYEIVPIRLDLSCDWSYDWSCHHQIYDITIAFPLRHELGQAYSIRDHDFVDNKKTS